MRSLTSSPSNTVFARRIGVLALLALAPTLPAQTVRVVDIAPPSASSATTFASVLNIFEFPNGRVAVNDPTSRQVVLLDRALAQPRVILDSVLAPSSYGPNSMSIVACNCNELWIPDVASRSILTFDETGAQKRVMSAPRAQDFGLILNARAIGDTSNHLFYRGRAPSPQIPGFPPRAGAPVVNPDSTALLRANFDTRLVDTVAMMRSLRSWVLYSSATTTDAKTASHIAVDILASIDEWTALPDGTIAIVRGHDYHVDWLSPNGKVVSSPKLPFDFKRLTDTDKAALMDSARKAEIKKRRDSYDKARAQGPNQTFTATAKAGSSGISLEAPRTITIPLGEFVEPIVDDVPFDRMPDYYPPIRAGAVTSDLAGNVWILPTTSAQSRAGELVYDVVNREHGLIARVRLPAGRSIAGFGRDGVVYLMSRDASGRWTIERTALTTKLM